MKQIGPPQGEELFNQLTQIFDIAQLRNMEPFLSRANLLKDLRYDIDVIKRNFPPKSHYHKNGNGSANGNSNKSRLVRRFDRIIFIINKMITKNKFLVNQNNKKNSFILQMKNVCFYCVLQMVVVFKVAQ